jgi:hypothetical protein
MRRPLIYLLAALALAVAMLLPVLKTGFISDDTANSCVSGILHYHGFSLADLVAQECRWHLLQGRFFPVMILQLRGVYHLLPGVTAYKAYLVLAVAVNLLLFAGLIRRLTGSPTLAALGLVAMACLFQLRFYHDALLSFHGFMQFIVTGMLLSLWSLDRFLTGDRPLWVVVAVLLYLPVLLTYEITYSFFLLHLALILARGRSWKAAGLTALPFLAAAVSCAAVPLVWRTFLGSNPGDAYRPNGDPIAITATLTRQLVAAFPLVSYRAHFKPLYPPYFVLMRSRPLPVFLVTAGAFALTLALFARLRQERPEGGIGPRGLVWMGLLLWLLPALPISLSPKYQKELVFGLGYLPVYTQYFGVALLFLAAAVRWSRRLERPATARIAAFVVALLIGHTYAANAALARFYAWDRGVRDNVEEALAAGLLDDVPDGATLLLDHPHPLWHLDEVAFGTSWSRNFSEYFYYLHTGKKIRTIVRGSSHWSSEVRGAVYEVRDVCTSSRGGYVLLIHRMSLLSPVADDIRICIRCQRGPTEFILKGSRGSDGGNATGEVVSLRGRDLVAVGHGPNGDVYLLPPRYGPLLADSLRLLWLSTFADAQ